MVLSQRLQQPWLVPAPPSGLPVSVDVQQPCLLGQSSVDVALQGQCLEHLGRCVGACVDTLYVVVVVVVVVEMLVELTIVTAKTKLSMVGWRQLRWQQLRGV